MNMTPGLDLRTDLIILLLYSKGYSGKQNEPIIGITRLMKLLFLLKEEAGINGLFNFEPYKMGPFSSEVYPEIEFLENFPSPDAPLVVGKKSMGENGTLSPEHLRLLEDIGENGSLSFSEINKEFRLSDKGEGLATKLWSQLAPEIKNKIESIKQKYGSMSLRELLRYVYDKYPSMTVRSEIKNQI